MNAARARMGLAVGLLLGLSGPLAHASPAVELVHLTSADEPVYVTHAGDERLFVVERAGRIQIYEPSQGLLATPFLDISALVDTSGDGGLLGLAFHPDYANNGLFFVGYTRSGAGAVPLVSVLARYEVSAADPDVADAASGVTLIEVDQRGAGHTIGQLEFGPGDGLLYAGFGDGAGGQTGCWAQQMGDTLGTEVFRGKILRIDVDENSAQLPYYGIPPSNPFASPSDGMKDEIWALGFRNPWRFSFDPTTHDLWIGDVGQATREEVDREAAPSSGGENYGWSIMEGTSCFDPDPVDSACPVGTPSCFDPAYAAPVFDYENTGFFGDACSVIGGYVYRRHDIPGLHGDYLFGDFCGGVVWALEETSPGVWSRTSLTPTLDRGLSSFGLDDTGRLLVVHDVDIYRLVPISPIPTLGIPVLALLAAVLLGTGVLRLTRVARSRVDHEGA